MTTNTVAYKDSAAIRQAWRGVYAAAQIVAHAPGTSPARSEARGELRAYVLMTSTLTGYTVEHVLSVAQRKV